MLKKGIIMLSIMVGISVGGIITNKPAHAKKDATITKISTNLKESSSYMTFTGKNALYTKAATMQGAKLVKSKAQLTQLAESKRGLNSFMWLRTATTNRGTVYFKVASFDYKIKGWIYAGRTTNYRLGLIYYLDEQHKNPAGGVADFHTMTDVAMTPEQKQSFYKLANPGTSSDGTAKVYSLPFDVAPITVTNFINMPNKKTSTPYKNDIFIIQKVVKNTRQGDVWYSVDDLNNDIMGYIRKSGLKKLATPAADKGITVNFVDATNHQKVGSVVVPFAPSKKQSGMDLTQEFGYYQGLPAGYSADFDDDSTSYGFTSASAKDAHPGAVLNYYVGKSSTN